MKDLKSTAFRSRKLTAAIIIALLLLFCTAFFWLAVTDAVPRPWEPSDAVFLVPMLAGAVAAIVWFALARRELPGSQAFFVSGLMGISVAALVFMSIPFVQFANSRFDPHPALDLSATVLEKTSARVEGRRGSHIVYRLSLEVSLKDRQRHDILVPYPIWSSVKDGDLLHVRLGEGLFGWRYIIEIAPVSKGPA